MDLFENYEEQPKELQVVLEKWNDRINDGLDYNGCRNLRQELENIGFTYDYGQDASPYNLRPFEAGGKKKFLIVQAMDGTIVSTPANNISVLDILNNLYGDMVIDLKTIENKNYIISNNPIKIGG